MLIVILVFIFFALLAVGYELHTITSRLIEIGTLVEHSNRRALRAAGLKDSEDDDLASESVTKTQARFAQILGGIVIAALVTVVILGVLGVISAR
jgi:CBS domain containing-hemolysin-like protein